MIRPPNDDKRVNKDQLQPGEVVYLPPSPLLLGDDQKRTLERLKTDFRFFAYHCLWIVDKSGQLIRFQFNAAQEQFHKAVELMLAETGMVRMIVLKGRQQGLSTYILARLYWIAITRSNKTICVLSHDGDSVADLFKKVDIYHKHIPENFQLKTKTDNKYAVSYANGSQFRVFTAGSGNAGVGGTSQYRHESERALVKDHKSIDAGIGQTTADLPGTEVYRESTARGFNHFQKEYTRAKRRDGKWRSVFIPWYLQDEYRTKPVVGFKRSEEEERIAYIYGLDDEQLQWRRDKISDLEDIKLFRREYPLNDVEAFQSSGDTHFDADKVSLALFNRKKIRGVGSVIIGCDPAGAGDRTVIVARRGREIFYMKVFKTMTGQRLIKILGDLIDSLQAVKCFIDMGYGHDVVDALRSGKYERVVVGVHFNAQAANPDIHSNKRTEMLFNVRKWIYDEPSAITCWRTDEEREDIAQDFGAIPEADAGGGAFSFPAKKKIKKDFGRSPDIVDAMMLTFAYPVKESDVNNVKPLYASNIKNNTSVSSFSRRRDLKRNHGAMYKAA